ncbi:hypothetical protein VE03_09194 [Pseudogymnoascus sp. 23342-1-I1]|nr:hypothetical protein VE03_09194 [Pseudogymnoascus sp. 23342-1-I1]
MGILPMSNEASTCGSEVSPTGSDERLDSGEQSEHTNHSDLDISWIGSFSTFMIFGVAPVADVLVDRFGPTASDLTPIEDSKT